MSKSLHKFHVLDYYQIWQNLFKNKIVEICMYVISLWIDFAPNRRSPAKSFQRESDSQSQKQLKNLYSSFYNREQREKSRQKGTQIPIRREILKFSKPYPRKSASCPRKIVFGDKYSPPVAKQKAPESFEFRKRNPFDFNFSKFLQRISKSKPKNQT